MSGPVKGLFAIGDGSAYHLNVQIPVVGSPGTFWPNLCDIYVPVGYRTSMVCLHGGSGSKSQMAIDMQVVVSPGNKYVLVNWKLLNLWKCIAIFPQGQACTGITNPWNPNGVDTRSAQSPNGITTWTAPKPDMWSQNNDPQFLLDLSAYITTTYGLAANAKTLMGHSEGGIMTTAMWREYPSSFSTFITAAGPSPGAYATAPVGPAAPTPPILGIQGYVDTTLADWNAYVNNVLVPGSIFTASLYWQDPGNRNRANVAFPLQGTRIGMWQDFLNWLGYNGDAPIAYGAGVTTPITIGNKVVWKNPRGNIQLWMLDSADHPLNSLRDPTRVSIQACLGNTLFSQIASFAAST